MKNKKIWLGMLVMVLVFGMTVIGCDNGTTGDDGSIDSAVWAQLVGQWNNVGGSTSLTFFENYLVRINLSYKGVKSLSSNRMVIVCITTEASFNFVISGNTLTVSNWSGFHSPAANAAAMNGEYTRV